MTNIEAQLRMARQKKLIVKFERPFETGTFTGFVMDVGPKFFLLAVLRESLEFEQYSFLRITDVRKLESPAKYSDFYKAVRKKRGDKMPQKIKVQLKDVASILHSQKGSLKTIHCELVDPDVCHIGVVMGGSASRVEMLEIDPAAKWDTKPGYYRLNQITRIDLPGPYEKALLLVSGQPRLKNW
jgi:hypothetical protein